ncbi:hypothetical protein EB796_016584 [Bugula neritina]|uniref:Ig-like domain-containing protein n=1 Tax=Bugula neritina TaxID=10212 RepID=A0A7J7JG82_BUGNE|nr:hypothetical protein EB796_016584 [Bugula neritina]
MGNSSSDLRYAESYSTNDFELVIRLAKDLEYFLTEHFQATGNGFGEKINSATCNNQKLPREITNALWQLNRERNKLVHDRTYNKIQNRQSFITTYQQAKHSLQQLISPSSGEYRCVIS